MKIVMGSDHAGFSMKNELIAYLKDKGHEVYDVGTYTEESCSYPVYGEKAARLVADGSYTFGIVVCGTGAGISLAANRVHGIRCVNCSEAFTASLARNHNNANMLAIGARVIGIGTAKAIVDAFLTSEFEGGRHQQRLDMLDKIK